MRVCVLSALRAALPAPRRHPGDGAGGAAAEVHSGDPRRQDFPPAAPHQSQASQEVALGRQESSLELGEREREVYVDKDGRDALCKRLICDAD